MSGAQKKTSTAASPIRTRSPRLLFGPDGTPTTNARTTASASPSAGTAFSGLASRFDWSTAK